MLVFRRIVSAGLLLLGSIHVAFTAVAFEEWSLDAVWFAGTGLSLVFAGLFNLACDRSTGRRVLAHCLVVNIMGSVYSVAVIVTLSEPRAWVGLHVFLAATASTLGLLLRPPPGGSIKASSPFGREGLESKPDWG
jgi:hypothetical protein